MTRSRRCSARCPPVTPRCSPRSPRLRLPPGSRSSSTSPAARNRCARSPPATPSGPTRLRRTPHGTAVTSTGPADRAAQAPARAGGDVSGTRRRHECGISHALTEPAVAERVVARMVKTHGHVNLGIEVGRSRVLVVDVDTAEQKQAFLAVWSDATGSDMSELAPTVLSPGKVMVDADGGSRWVHKDGGHYYFALPDDVDLADLPGSGILTGPEGWVAIFRDKQVIVPPSVRAAGGYRAR